MPIPSLPDLPADLHRLIHMQPDLGALELFLGIPPEQDGALRGDSRTSLFTVSNVFSAPQFSPDAQRRYSIIVDSTLADAQFDAGRLSALDIDAELREVRASVEMVGTLTLRDGSCKEFNLVEAIPQARNMFMAKYGPVHRKFRREQQRHSERLCTTLYLFWRDALASYGTAPRYKGNETRVIPEYLQDTACSHPLFLTPHISLPRVDLLDQLRAEQRVAEFLILTGRHELGHYYEIVRGWHQRGEHDGWFSSLNRGLNTEQLQCLSARQRHYRYYATGQVVGKWGDPRTDAPIERREYSSDLARMYDEFLDDWYRPYYFAAVEAATCQFVDPDTGKRCPHTLTYSPGPGVKSSYCDAHRKIAKRLKDRARQKRYRDT